MHVHIIVDGAARMLKFLILKSQCHSTVRASPLCPVLIQIRNTNASCGSGQIAMAGGATLTTHKLGCSPSRRLGTCPRLSSNRVLGCATRIHQTSGPARTHGLSTRAADNEHDWSTQHDIITFYRLPFISRNALPIVFVTFIYPSFRRFISFDITITP